MTKHTEFQISLCYPRSRVLGRIRCEHSKAKDSDLLTLETTQWEAYLFLINLAPHSLRRLNCEPFRSTSQGDLCPSAGPLYIHGKQLRWLQVLKPQKNHFLKGLSLHLTDFMLSSVKHDGSVLSTPILPYLLQSAPNPAYS